MLYRLALVLSSAALLSGCNIGSMARVNPNTVASYGVPDSRPGTVVPKGFKTNAECPLTSGLDDTQNGAINLDCFKFPGDKGDKTAYQLAAMPDAKDKHSAVHARNRLSAILLKHADDVCVLEKGRIVGREGALNFGLSSATTALSTVSTVVGGELAKSILSGGAAFTSGVRGHAAESFYRNQVTQAINAAMDGERKNVRAKIEKRRKDDLSAFTVDEMIWLANEYHQACSYERGLQLLVKAAVRDDIANNRDAATRMANLMFQRDAIDRALAGKLTPARRKELEERRAALEDAIFDVVTAAEDIQGSRDDDGDVDDAGGAGTTGTTGSTGATGTTETPPGNGDE